MPGLLDECGQQVKQLGRQRDRLSVAKELPFVDVESIRPEREQALDGIRVTSGIHPDPVRTSLPGAAIVEVPDSIGGRMTTLRCTAIVCCVAAMMIPATVAHADTVLDWNIHASNAIVTVGAQSPPRAFIRLAMVHLAIYDAVNAIEGQPFEPYASAPQVARPASADAAVATAAHDILVALFPAQTADLGREVRGESRRDARRCRARTELPPASRRRPRFSSRARTMAGMER